MAVRSKHLSKNHEFDFVCPFLHIKMPFIASNHTYYQRRYIPLHIETDFSPPSQIVSEYQHQSWKMLKKRPYSIYRRLHFARGSCFDANDTRYSRPFFSLSNRLYRMSAATYRLPSNRHGIRAVQARFSQFSFFPCLMLNEWRTFARATGAPSLASGPKFNTTC